jgi:DNA-binding response OmpR family regulator
MRVRPTVLIVDDDPLIRDALHVHLRDGGYETLLAADGRQAIALLERETPALALIDLALPGAHGFDVARRIKRHADIPIVVVSGIDVEEAKVKALHTFAEDYVTKPFSFAELQARVARILRYHPPGVGGSPKRLDEDASVDFDAGVLCVRGEERPLTATETRLLYVLSSNAGRILPFALLLDRVWPDRDASVSSLWEYVRRLRRKLDDDTERPRYIECVSRVGYRFRARFG